MVHKGYPTLLPEWNSTRTWVWLRWCWLHSGCPVWSASRCSSYCLLRGNNHCNDCCTFLKCVTNWELLIKIKNTNLTLTHIFCILSWAVTRLNTSTTSPIWLSVYIIFIINWRSTGFSVTVFSKTIRPHKHKTTIYLLFWFPFWVMCSKTWRNQKNVLLLSQLMQSARVTILSIHICIVY